MKDHNGKKSYQPTALQRLYQQKFKLATAALRPLNKILDTGYGEFVSATRKDFIWHFPKR
ncbi:hypothetical protein [Algoriphagus boritolerans]|uniref:hypothetical protein n=1 Tax=Algoriphagus boritolerans TaxID=308111 RepID=UPI000A7340E4